MNPPGPHWKRLNTWLNIFNLQGSVVLRENVYKLEMNLV